MNKDIIGLIILLTFFFSVFFIFYTAIKPQAKCIQGVLYQHVAQDVYNKTTVSCIEVE
jgi:hypothetical protein